MTAVKLTRVTGPCCLSQADETRLLLSDALSSAQEISLDLSQVTTTDISFVQILFAASKSANELNKTLTISHMSPAVADVFRSAGGDAALASMIEHS